MDVRERADELAEPRRDARARKRRAVGLVRLDPVGERAAAAVLSDDVERALGGEGAVVRDDVGVVAALEARHLALELELVALAHPLELDLLRDDAVVGLPVELADARRVAPPLEEEHGGVRVLAGARELGLVVLALAPVVGHRRHQRDERALLRHARPRRQHVLGERQPVVDRPPPPRRAPRRVGQQPAAPAPRRALQLRREVRARRRVVGFGRQRLCDRRAVVRRLRRADVRPSGRAPRAPLAHRPGRRRARRVREEDVHAGRGVGKQRGLLSSPASR